MNKCIVLLSLSLISSTLLVGSQKTLDTYISEAQKLHEANDLKNATAVLEEAITIYPENSTAHAYLGLYTGVMAGQTDDFLAAGQFAGKSFQLLDKAVSLDSSNFRARFYRGIMGINVPVFMGRLDQGIDDLKRALSTETQSPGSISKDDLISLHTQLATGYQKKGNEEEVIKTLKKIIQIAPGSSHAEEAENRIKSLESGGDDKKSASLTKPPKQLPKDTEALIDTAKNLINRQQHNKALDFINQSIEEHSKDPDLIFALVNLIDNMCEQGYNQGIYEDQQFMTTIAFKLVEWYDQIVKLDPDNMGARLQKSTMDVLMPFFVNKLDQGIQGLEILIKSNATDSIKSEALFWLGYGYQKKAMSHWNTIATKYESYPVYEQVLENMRPKINRIDIQNINKPIVTIEFTHGFQDALAPQTAVWVETVNNQYVKTIYVSGFSGYVKEKQVVLPKWAKYSQFKGVESVTGASIDVGHHIYTWDCQDLQGKKVKSGQYTIRIEVCHWPTNKYQIVDVPITVGKKPDHQIVEEGDFIPYSEVKYIPK